MLSFTIEVSSHSSERSDRRKLRRVSWTAPKGRIRIELTPEQKAKVRNATGQDAETIELSVEELEERIAPKKKGIIGGPVY